MEKLHNGFTLELSPGAFPLSTDSIALAHFVKPGPNARILDLCSGCGTLGLYLCAADATCQVTGIEIDENAHEMALHNASVNGISHRLTSICSSIECLHNRISPGSFSVCVSNPPYFSGGPKSSRLSTARQEELCTLDMVITAAARSLKYGGDFYIVHRPERLAEIFIKAGNQGLEPKKLLLLRHKENGPVTLVLAQCRKGGKPGLVWQEEFLFNADGQPSDYYRSIYHN